MALDMQMYRSTGRDRKIGIMRVVRLDVEEVLVVRMDVIGY